MIMTDLTPAEQTTITITTCVLMVIVCVAFMIWLFVWGKETQKLNNEKTKLEIKKLKQEIESYEDKKEFRKTEIELMKRKIEKCSQQCRQQ